VVRKAAHREIHRIHRKYGGRVQSVEAASVKLSGGEQCLSKKMEESPNVVLNLATATDRQSGRGGDMQVLIQLKRVIGVYELFTLGSEARDSGGYRARPGWIIEALDRRPKEVEPLGSGRKLPGLG
jgi:hypothetical protein